MRRFIFSIILIIIFGCKSTQAFKVSDLKNDKNLSGLAFDSVRDRVLVEDQFKEWIHLWVNFLSILKDDVSLTTINLFLTRCHSKEEHNPFCGPILNFLEIKKHNSNRLGKRQRNDAIKEARRGLRKYEFQPLASLSEGDLAQVLKPLFGYPSIRLLIRKVLEAKECPSPALLTALGLKVESEFPVEKFKQLAESLYQRSVTCGPSASSVQAAYRLGLLQVWADRCDLAEDILSRIPDDSFAVDYRMRTAYWRLYCAGHLKREDLRLQLKKWIVKEYPLSLHSLLARTDSEIRDWIVSNEEDPEISFRSTLDPELNSVTRAIEILLLHGDLNTASNLIGAHLERAMKVELPFQLYWAILLKRSENEAGSFQLMASIFRSNPHLISKSTLGLMYPLNGLEAIQKDAPSFHGSMDPYLILSVIRQESAFDPMAKSPAGALGLMQLQLPTAQDFEKISKMQLYDPRVNVRVGVKYFTRLLKASGSLETALVAYNAGPKRLKQWKKRYPMDNRLLFTDLLPVRETRDYVSSITRNYYWYLTLYSALGAGSSGTIPSLPFFKLLDQADENTSQIPAKISLDD